MRDCMKFYANVLERGDDDRLHVPMSTSPEYFSNELPAWTADPTCDLALVRNLARWCIRAAEILDRDADLREQWQDIDRDLAPYPVSERGLKVQPDIEFTQPHRHPMHLAPVFPLGDVHIEGDDADRQLVNASLDTWLNVGTGEWTGWSFPYASLILTRAKRANRAYEMLDMYRLGFIWPNGFHVNGDYKKQGFSRMTGTAFTVEGELAFTAAINEMLLQSWGDTIRVFPAVPDKWPTVAFDNLRAEGAVLVSARRDKGRVTKLTLVPERDLTTTVAWTLAPGESERRERVHLSAGVKVNLVNSR
jgi:alpha-L-fucosidase 2